MAVGLGGTVSTFDNILKEFYLGPVQEQLNQEVLVIELFEKAVVDWNGKHAIIPVHTARNSGVGFRSDSSEVLPAAGNQSFGSLQVKAKFQYGRFQVTGPAIASAAKGSANSFISYVDAEMNHLVEDVRDSANKSAITGGRVKGFISHRGAFNATGGSGQEQDFAEFSTGLPVVYDGDFTPFNGCSATADTKVRVELVQMDTYATYAGTQTNLNVFVVGADESAGTLTLSLGIDEASATTETLAGVADPHPCAVMLASTAGVDKDGTTMGGVNPATSIVAATAADAADNPYAVYTAANTMTLASEPTGVFGNLADPVLFGTARSSSTNAGLLSTIVTCNAGEDATDRAALSTGRMQAVLDDILRQSGSEPDVILINPLLRQQYSELLMNTATAVGLTTDTSKPAAHGSAGYTGFSYAGIPIQTSRGVPKGCMIFLKKDTWKLCELEKGGFADLDGNVLSRCAGEDAYEGFYRWYWNLVCTRPNANGILTGITLP